MFMNGTTVLGNEGSAGESETQIRKGYKAAKGDKVVTKQREAGAQGSTDSRAQTVRCAADFLLILNKGWRGMSCMGEPWLWKGSAMCTVKVSGGDYNIWSGLRVLGLCAQCK